MTTSAEQLAIALLGEARKLYRSAATATRPGQMEELEALADRLAGWATDVRALGVELAQANEKLEKTLAAIREMTDE